MSLLLIAAFFTITIWLIIISLFSVRLSIHYTNLVKDTNRRTLQAILETLLKDVASTKKDIEILKADCGKIIEQGNFHIQKIGLVRFNPFKDTGGDQSFILVLLDGKDNGVAISGLYSRGGTRWYAKKIKSGKGIEHELSEEEKQAIQQAQSVDNHLTRHK